MKLVVLFLIASIKSKRLKSIPHPIYYVIEAERGIDVDFPASGIPLDENGKPMPHLRPKDRTGMATVRLDSWNGKHLVSRRNSGWPMYFICSEKIKDLAEKKGWTNVKFVEVPII